MRGLPCHCRSIPRLRRRSDPAWRRTRLGQDSCIPAAHRPEAGRPQHHRRRQGAYSVPHQGAGTADHEVRRLARHVHRPAHLPPRRRRRDRGPGAPLRVCVHAPLPPPLTPSLAPLACLPVCRCQFEALARNPDILIATPGRLMHLLQEVETMSLARVELVTFDECDRLFEMGFAEQIHSILKRLPEERQVCPTPRPPYRRRHAHAHAAWPLPRARPCSSPPRCRSS